MAGRRGRRAAADPAVHLLEPAGDHRRHVRGGDQRRPQLLARDPHRRHSARPQPAGGQQQRDVAADRGRLGVQAADRHAGGRVRRRPDGGRELRRQVGHEPVPRVRGGLPDGCRHGTPSPSWPRRSARRPRCGTSRTGPSPWEGRSRCRSCTAERIAASSSRRSSRRTPRNRRPRRSARCRPASSRTATSRASSMPATRAMPARARSSGPTRSAGRSGSARSTTRARRASSTAAWSRDPFPNNQVPRAVWDAVARNTLEQGLWDAPELDRLFNNQPVLGTCCPVFEQNTFAVKFDQVINTQHRASFYVNREWRTRNNSPAGRYGPPPGSPTNLYQLQNTPSWMIRASENWVISDRLLHRFSFGYNRFGERQPERLFQPGLALEDRPAEPAGHDVPAVRLRRDGDPGQSGQFRIHLPRRELRGQHDRPGRSDVHHRTPQHQDRLRGALLLRRQRNRRRDGHLQLQLGADEPARVRSDRPGTPTRASCSAPSRRPAVRSRRSTRTTSSAISASTCRTTSRSPPSSR